MHSQVKLILKDYNDKSDVVTEFVQNTDDFGATELTFVLSDEKFGAKRVVDSRCAALQGNAIYILSNKELREEDIKRMQRVGRSAKSVDFASTGRFGVGMNVFYRYSDCPQLFANGRIHFFDLTRNFVAKTNETRGKQFNRGKLEEMFPDSVQPFHSYIDDYPVVFRLPLRTRKSELGEKVELASVENDLRAVSANAFSMLLFAKSLQKLRFQGPRGVVTEHTAVMTTKSNVNSIKSSSRLYQMGSVRSNTVQTRKSMSQSGSAASPSLRRMRPGLLSASGSWHIRWLSPWVV